MVLLSFVLGDPSEYSPLKLLYFIYSAPTIHIVIYGFKYGNFVLQYCSSLSLIEKVNKNKMLHIIWRNMWPYKVLIGWLWSTAREIHTGQFLCYWVQIWRNMKHCLRLTDIIPESTTQKVRRPNILRFKIPS